MRRMVCFFVAVGFCATFGGNSLVIDCHPPCKGYLTAKEPSINWLSFIATFNLLWLKKFARIVGGGARPVYFVRGSNAR